MKDELTKMTEQWMQLERKTMHQRQVADSFYEKKLMKLIEESFLENNKEKCMEEVEYLIMSVGTSYEPIVLSISIFHPKKILFLFTEKTETVLDKIVKYCKLDVSAFDKELVHETNPLDIYVQIKNIYLKWNQPEKVYIDFTGGTKAMSAAAAMAGAMINIQLVYIGTNEYLTDFRKPNPGSETLFFIQNPVEVFGDLEAGKAMALFAQHNYAGAAELIQKLKEQVPDPNMRQQLKFAWLLAKGYEHWDALEFQNGLEYMHCLTTELKRDQRIHRRFLMMDFYDRLVVQENMLEELSKIPAMIKEKRQLEILKNDPIMIPLMFTMFYSAEVRRAQEKYDMATLLLYRLLEMMEQKRLAKYELYISAMNYHSMVIPVGQAPQTQGMDGAQKLEWLKYAVNGMKKELFGRIGSGYLPDQVSLLEGFIILQALRDPIMCKGEKQNLDEIRRIRAMVYLRNNSIFAHGLGPVAIGDFERFREYVLSLFRRFCEIEGIDFQKTREAVRWMNPMDSVYYSGMGV